MGLQAYSFNDVKASIVGPGGAIIIGSDAGSAEEGITSSMIEEKGTTTPGADGQIMHSLHAASVGLVTIRLLKTSPANALLSTLYAFQTVSAGVWGQNVVVVTDIERGDLFTLEQSAFVKWPDTTWAKDGNANEWAFRGKLTPIFGAGIPDINT